MKEEFLAFLQSLINHTDTKESWQKFAVTHYLDDRLEELRRAIVRVAVEDNPMGTKKELSDDALSKIKDIVEEFEVTV